MNNVFHSYCRYLVAFLMLVLSGCTVTDTMTTKEAKPTTNTVANAASPITFDASQRWVLLPIQNHTGQPQAGEQVEAILGAILQARGLKKFAIPPDFDKRKTLPELSEQQRYERALEWARSKGYTFGMTGSVLEWQYKSGIEGEPVASLILQVLDISTGQIIWSTVGGRSGWGRESLNATGQKLLHQLLDPIRIENAAGGNTN